MNVLIIPEDFRKDQYILKPIIEKMLAHMGLRARVRVYTDPKLGGVGEALTRSVAIVRETRNGVGPILGAQN